MPAHFSQDPRPRRLLALFDPIRSRTRPTLAVSELDVEPPVRFPWPAEPSIESIADAIAQTLDIEITINPIPEDLRHREISGLTTMAGRTAHVYYDQNLSPLNREQTIFHEFAHILHGDVRPGITCTFQRSMFDDPREKRAELTGLHLLNNLHRHRMNASDAASEAIAFMTGRDTFRSF